MRVRAFPIWSAVTLDTHADTALLVKLAGLAERFSPSVAIDDPHGLLIDITGCAHLFGGEVGLRARLCWLLRQLGFAVRATVAATPDAARALARFSQHQDRRTGHRGSAGPAACLLPHLAWRTRPRVRSRAPD